MAKLLAILGICTVIIASYGATFHMGRKYERADTKAEKYDDLAKATQGIVGYFTQLSVQTNELNAVKPNPPAGPNVNHAVSIMQRDRAQYSGPVTSPPKPAVN